MTSAFWPLLPGQQVQIAPLRRVGLRQAIEQPARDVGVHLDSRLTDRLLTDAAREPGAQPLLQETLRLLWQRLDRRFLALQAYMELGMAEQSGLAVALARHADAVLVQPKLAMEQRATAQRILVRLIQFGEGRPDTRRQQTVEQLRSAGEAPLSFAHTLEHLAHYRLITVSGEDAQGRARTVDLAHESLIAGWPQLHTWVQQRRDAEQTRRRLESKATAGAETRRNGRASD